MLFDDRHGLPALQAGAKLEFFLIHATQNTACAGRGESGGLSQWRRPGYAMGGSLRLCEEQSDVAIRSTVHAPPPPHARRRRQPTSSLKAKLQLCTLGHTGRKHTKHIFPALQAGAKQELCFHTRRRPEPTPSEGATCAVVVAIRRHPVPVIGRNVVQTPNLGVSTQATCVVAPPCNDAGGATWRVYPPAGG
jgi:hypothetical protein